MRYLHIVILLLLIACGGGSGSGSVNTAVYYIDPSASSNGTGSEASPFNTFSGISFETGAEYLIKRGTVLSEEITINVPGNPGDPIVIGAYGSGAEPVIDGSEYDSGWVLASGDVYKTTAPAGTEGLGNVSDNNVMLNYEQWDTNEATTIASMSPGSFSFNPSSNVVYVWRTSGAIPDNNVKLSIRIFGIHGNNVSYITIQDVHIKQASRHGIHFEDSDHITVSNSIIEMCGGSYIGAIQAGNGIEFGNSSSQCTVTGCTITDIFDSGISPQTYDSNQTASGFTFTGNTISKCGFAGVEISVLSNGGKTGSILSDVTVSSCIISSCGTGFSGIRYGNEGRGIKIAADSSAGSLNSIKIEDSTITQSEGEGIFINGETGLVEISRTRISANKRDGIAVQDASSTTTGLKITASIIRDNVNEGLAYNAVSGKGLEVYNCTFYNNSLIDLSVYSNSGYLRLKNNIYYSSVTHLYLATFVAGAEIDYNCYFQNSSAVIGVDSNSYDSVSAFKAAYPSCDNSSTGVDPSLDGSFVPGSTNCRGKGVYLPGITADLNGNSYRNPPTMGALEY